MDGARSNATVRLFLALWPESPVRAALAAHQQAWHWPQHAALVAAERLHLTLHFIGDVDAARTDGLRRALATPFQPFVLALANARPTLWPGGLAVLEFDPPEPLRSLHGQLGRALLASGLPPQARVFRPHVTLARKAAGAGAAVDVPRAQWPVENYVLVRSAPGLGYRTIQTYAST